MLSVISSFVFRTFPSVRYASIFRVATLVLTLILTNICLSHALDIAGTVVDSAGKPIAGARVGVWEADVQLGEGYMGGKCYPDSSRYGYSDETGAFVIKDLDEKFSFVLMAVKAGYVPRLATNPGVDLDLHQPNPVAPTTRIVLAARPAAEIKGSVLRGRLLDGEGKPVPNAIVEPLCLVRVNGTDVRDDLKGDALAATDDNGDFALVLDKTEHPAITVVAYGHTLARKICTKLEFNKTHEIRLTSGTTVKGRLIHDGKPMAGMQIGLVSTRTRGLGPEWDCRKAVVTDAQGMFAFEHIPAGISVCVYAIGMPLAERGLVSPAPELATGSERSIVDAGDLVVTEGVVLPGRIVLENGGTWPANAVVSMSRYLASDAILSPVKPDGTFTVRALPDEHVTISTAPYGHKESINSEFYRKQWDDDKSRHICLSVEIGKRKELVFRLVKVGTKQTAAVSHMVHGRILDSTGKPVTDAVVASHRQTTESEPGRWEVIDGKIGVYGSEIVPEPSPDGSFSVSVPHEGFTNTIIYSREKGFRVQQLKFADSQQPLDITLSPWCEVAGKAYYRGKPAAGMNVQLQQYVGPDSVAVTVVGAGFASLLEHVTTDAQGEFVFRKASAGQGDIGRVPLGTIPVDYLSVEVKPGEAGHYILGQSGAAVTGKVEISTELKELIDKRKTKMSVSFRYGGIFEAMPAAPAGQDQMQWEMDWIMNTPEGQAYNKKYSLSFAAEVNPDGTFSTDCLAPGEYELEVIAHVPDDAGLSALISSSANTLVITEADAQSRAEKQAPAMSPLQKHQAYQPKQPDLPIGSDAPAFSFNYGGDSARTGATTFNNSSLKGKITVLRFTGLSNRDVKNICRDDKLTRSALQDAGLPLARLQWFNTVRGDVSPSLAAAYDSPWPLIAASQGAALRKAFGLEACNGTVILGPDGKVLSFFAFPENIRRVSETVQAELRRLH